MAINIKRYIDIVSGVGAGTAVRLRDLITRVFTSNPLVPTQSLIEFTSADDVGTYFGTTSEEYKRAVFYFGWISKLIRRPKKISFARWANVAVAARVFGNTAAKALADFTGVTTGSFSLTLGGSNQVITGLNLSSAASLAAVATLVQTAIRAKTGAAFTGATVSYNAARNSFELTSGTVGAGNVVVTAAGSGTDIAGPLGWLTGNAIVSNGSAAETLTQTLTSSADASSNFGSFAFIDALTLQNSVEVATWNDTQNVAYIYLVPIAPAAEATYSTALIGYSGVAMTASRTTGEYPEYVPGMILAATDYTARNSAQNYMYQAFTLTPAVSTTLEAATLDVLRVNYYGVTQTAGQNLSFYQRGVLTGLAVDPVDMNTYANEAWFKDAAAASLMELLLSLSRISANTKGRGQVMAQLQSVIDQALFNGVISIGKPFTQTQKSYIIETTGDENAWRQVQNLGYWLNATIQSETTQDGRTEWKAVYTLIYSKDDTIRSVDGSHVLI